MKYKVDWLPAAEQELADIWLQAADRNAVSQAAHAIDQVLEIDPDHAGESRPEGRRIFFGPPLGVLFRVIEDDKLVQVIQVWRFATRD
jgi:plasmid stabilization system protein ParE